MAIEKHPCTTRHTAQNAQARAWRSGSNERGLEGGCPVRWRGVGGGERVHQLTCWRMQHDEPGQQAKHAACFRQLPCSAFSRAAQ
jgi:hypothetical protein